MPQPIKLAHILTGQWFTLTEDGKFKTQVKEFYNFRMRPSAEDPDVEIAVAVFKDDLGVIQEMRTDTDVWIVEE